MEKTAMASSSPNIYSWKNKITATSISSSKFQLNFSSNRKFSDFSIISLSQSHYCCNSSEKSEKSSSKTQILSSDDSDFAFRSCKSSVKLKSIKLEVNGSKKANGRRMNLKSLFNKESLWRRILFASRKVRSIILLNVTTLIYASNIPVVKEVEAIMDPAAFNAVRFAVSVIPFLPFIFRARRHSRTRKAGLELGLWVSLGYLMQALGLLTSDAGRASFISMLTVIVVPLLDGLLGAVVSPLTWFGATMSVIGVGMLESSGSPPSVGDFLNFMSAVFFGIHMLRTERISRITEKKNFLALLGYEVCVVAFLSVMWYLLGGWFSGSQGLYQHAWTWEFFWASLVSFPWIPALYTGIFSTGLCLWVEMTAMRDVSATETAIIYGLEPVWGAGFAWFLLGERWGTAGWIGAALVLGGSLTVQMFGSMPHGKNERGDEKSKTEDHLTASPVVVRSREDDN